MTLYHEEFLRSGNTIARAERIWIKPISDYTMEDLSLALGKALCQAFSRESGKRIPAKHHLSPIFQYFNTRHQKSQENIAK